MLDRGELEARLAAIKRAYIAELPARAAGLQAAWEHVQAEDWAQAPLQELHRLAHSLAGSGATFGFADVSAHARTLELPLRALLQDTSPDSVTGEHLAGYRMAVPELLTALLAALDAAAQGT